MDASEIADVANTVFFSFGALAILLGAPLALKRLFLEQPYAQAWEQKVDDCAVRRIQEGANKGRYSYRIHIDVMNRSRSVQKVTGYWIKGALPFQDQPAGRRTPFEQLKEVQKFFCGQAIDIDREIAAEDSFYIELNIIDDSLDHVVNLSYCFETRSRRLLWFGYEDRPRFYGGSSAVSVRLDDIRFYSGNTNLSTQQLTPAAGTPPNVLP